MTVLNPVIIALTFRATMGRKRALLHHFGSARAVAVATLEDIKAVPGISGALAQKIHDHFRGGR